MPLIQILIESKIGDKIEKYIRKNKNLIVSDYDLRNWVIDTIIKIDPTKNKKYVRWIVQKATSNSNLERLEQDWEKYHDWLQVFHNNKKSGKLEENDIFKLNSWNELYKVVKPFMPIEPSDWKNTIDDLDEGKDYTIEKKTSKFKLISVLTQKAASYLGGDTEWCTTYGEYCLNKNWQNRDSDFPRAIKEGEVYILWETGTDRRWQFQFESDQFMNEEDYNEVDVLLETIKKDKEMYHYFMSILFKKIGEGKIDPRRAIENELINMKEIDDELYKQLISIISEGADDPIGKILSLHFVRDPHILYEFYNNQGKIIKNKFDKNDFLKHLLERDKNYTTVLSKDLLISWFNITKSRDKHDRKHFDEFVKKVKDLSNIEEIKSLAIEYNYLNKYSNLIGFIPHFFWKSIPTEIYQSFTDNMYDHFLEEQDEFELTVVHGDGRGDLLYFITK